MNSLNGTSHHHSPKKKCPSDWSDVTLGEAFSIAEHPSLHGDDLLGENAQTRFLPKRFHDNGNALDAKDKPCPKLACPICHHPLPTGFFDTEQHFMSLVGAPSSGKSYFLPLSIYELKKKLPPWFHCDLGDCDPEYNQDMNDSIARLTDRSGTHQSAFRAKTQMDASLYQQVRRVNDPGYPASQPKPFAFRLGSTDDPNRHLSMIVYDNAGEHFQPGRNTAQSPGGAHVAFSSAILFLFDPLADAAFSHWLREQGVQDPQLNAGMEVSQGRKAGESKEAEKRREISQQGIILNEVINLIRQKNNLRTGERLDKPMAFIIGKADSWLHLLPPQRFDFQDTLGRDSNGHGFLRLDALLHNSALIKGLLAERCPNMLEMAEGISTNVMYFHASALGCAPESFDYVEKEGESSRKEIGPDPGKINPLRAETPWLWALSQLQKDLVPCHK